MYFRENNNIGTYKLPGFMTTTLKKLHPAQAFFSSIYMYVAGQNEIQDKIILT